MSLVGQDMRLFPYISPFGRIYRLSRLNSLSVGQIGAVLSTPRHVVQALKNGWHLPFADVVPWDSIQTLHHSKEIKVRELDEWYPFRLSRRTTQLYDLLNTFRACRSCVAYGYHSVIHQLPWIIHCPWHDEPIITKCACGLPLFSLQNGIGRRIMQCQCGIDHYDKVKALSGLDNWPSSQVLRLITRYLNEASYKAKGCALLSRIDPPLALVNKVLQYPKRSTVNRNEGVRSNGIVPVACHVYQIDSSSFTTNLKPSFVRHMIEDWNYWERNNRAIYSSFSLTPSSMDRVGAFAKAIGRGAPLRNRRRVTADALISQLLVNHDGCWRTRPGLLCHDEIYVGILLLEGLIDPPMLWRDNPKFQYPAYDRSILPASEAIIESLSHSNKGQVLAAALSELVAAAVARRMFELARIEVCGRLTNQIIDYSNMAMVFHDAQHLVVRIGHFLHFGSRHDVPNLTGITDRFLKHRKKVNHTMRRTEPSQSSNEILEKGDEIEHPKNRYMQPFSNTSNR